jgi:NAD(P)H-flavin reductase
MLYVFGTGEVLISNSGNPYDPRTLIHTTRAVGAVTNVMVKLKKGDLIGIRGPYGSPWPVELAEGKDVVIVRGGIGLPPLRPAIFHILKHRDRYNKVVLLYGARTKDEIMYPRELEKWRSRFDLEVHITVDRGTGDWRGNVGVVTTLIPRAAFDHLNALAMVCGPEVMFRFTVIELLKRGLPDESIYVSMERNMKCGVGLCGHRQFGPKFICKDGPVFRFDHIKDFLDKQEI